MPKNDYSVLSSHLYLENPEIWRKALGCSLTPQGLVVPVVPQYQSFPWVAVIGRCILAELKTIVGERSFRASSELNLLNTILLEDKAEKDL